MTRQLFLHHYLPSHLISALAAGSVLNFILTEEVNVPLSKAGLTTRLRPAVRAKTDRKGKMVLFGLVLIVMATYWFLSPFTYGAPSLTGDQVNARKLLRTWTLHFEGVSHQSRSSHYL